MRARQCIPTHASPWSVVFYCDEVTPGNPLKALNTRKLWVIYWSFLQLGEALCDEEVWFLLSVVKTSTVREVAGGWSHIFNRCTKTFYEDYDCRQGLVFKYESGESLCLICVLLILVADEAGLKAVWSCTGASGLKPCMICLNLLQGSAVVDGASQLRADWRL